MENKKNKKTFQVFVSKSEQQLLNKKQYYGWVVLSKKSSIWLGSGDSITVKGADGCWRWKKQKWMKKYSD